MAIERRSVPISTLSLAYSKSAMVTRRLPTRAARRAASFTRLARSAPEKPGVPRASTRGSTSGASGTLRMWTLRIFSRPPTSGLGTMTWRSKRPGRSSAGSSTSGRLVAAIRMTPSLDSKPSISTSNWFSVCSRSSLPPPRPAPRWRPTASISSMNTMQGAFFLACSNMSRTRRGAHAHEHLDEVGARDGEERHVGFAGDGARQQRLTGARGADQQAALGDLAAQPLELLRVLQEVDDLLELGLGLVDAGDVLEGDAAVLLGQQARPRLAEAHGAAGAALHLAQEEDVDADQHQDRQPAHEDRAEVDALLGRTGVDAVDVLDQHRHELLVDRGAGHIGRELLHAVARLAEGAGDGVALDTDVLDLALLDGAHEVRIRNRVARRPGRSALEDAVEQRQQQHDDNPQGSVTVERVHGFFPTGGEFILNGNQLTRRKQKKQPESGAAPRFCHSSCHARAEQSTAGGGFVGLVAGATYMQKE